MDFSLLDETTAAVPASENYQNDLALASGSQGTDYSVPPYLGGDLFGGSALSNGGASPAASEEALADAYIRDCLKEGQQSLRDTCSNFDGSDFGLPTFGVTQYDDTLQPPTPGHHHRIDTSSYSDCTDPPSTSGSFTDTSKDKKGHRHGHGRRSPAIGGSRSTSETLEGYNAQLEKMREIPPSQRTAEQANKIREIADRVAHREWRKKKKIEKSTARCARNEKGLSYQATLKSENDLLKAQLTQMTSYAQSLQGQLSHSRTTQSIYPSQTTGGDSEILLSQERERSRRLAHLNQFILNDLPTNVITKLHERSNGTFQELEQVLKERGQRTLTQDLSRRLLAEQRSERTGG
ncbi:hypothetical protein I302_102908 [Kwoniella bestiolae CBS 10118]|uniref:Uncharacterized protein n=1 Tax=Kwoniella bestiolae CBS 10118 TaxID=1296100 RepID=A0A1B9GGJ7_9TREE|nr:hypothetical protein I302_01604 [Kwoniella bestiolae CBS 10118]OCF30085.1 hypothetical protein I302_01604 [Kwoniella bestiolae CBS 10118]